MTWSGDLHRVTLADGRYMVGASFRGVPFLVETGDRSGGRRTVTHEFPLRDKPYVDDLGRRARVYSIEGYLVGDDCLRRRDDLLVALEEVAGPGELVHPYHGVRRVICSSLAVRESIADGRMVRFSIEFTEASAQELNPDQVVDYSGRVATSATAALAATQVEFDAGYSVAGLPAFALEGPAAALDALTASLGESLAPIVRSTQELARLDVEIRSLRSRASSLVRQPAVVLGTFQGVLVAVAATVLESPGAVLRAFVAAYSADTGVLPPLTTSTRLLERANQLALVTALQRILAIEAARLAPLATFDSHEEATAVRDEVAALLDEQCETASDEAYPALVQLRADLVRAVPGDAVLARILTIERRVSLPSLLLAYQLYGSVDMEADILARNQIRHPGVIAGTLRVLSDV